MAPLRGGRKRKPYYKEHCSSIGKKKGYERGLRACYHHDLLVIKETKYGKIFVHNCLRSLRASFIFFWTACLPWSSRLVFWMVSDLLCQDKLKKTIFMSILFHENPFLESVSWCQVCERRNRLENLVRDEIGRGGSRTLLSVLESIMIPRGEVSKLENRVAEYPLLGLCSHPCLQCAEERAWGIWTVGLFLTVPSTPNPQRCGWYLLIRMITFGYPWGAAQVVSGRKQTQSRHFNISSRSALETVASDIWSGGKFLGKWLLSVHGAPPALTSALTRVPALFRRSSACFHEAPPKERLLRQHSTVVCFRMDPASPEHESRWQVTFNL